MTDDFTAGYALGFAAGQQVGRLRLDRELTEQDRRRMAYLHGLASCPAYAELERRRWDGPRQEFGRPRAGDFPGFGAAYEPPVTGSRPRSGRGAA